MWSKIISPNGFVLNKSQTVAIFKNLFSAKPFFIILKNNIHHYNSFYTIFLTKKSISRHKFTLKKQFQNLKV
ncbi:hypothetical protein MCETHM1_02646 [Flavobacteriaceae bacterium]